MYTKGEWEVSSSGKRIWVTGVDSSGIHFVEPIAEIKDLNKHAEANAQLIAAAPDLYEACKWLLEDCDINEGARVKVSTKTQIIKALAKADCSKH